MHKYFYIFNLGALLATYWFLGIEELIFIFAISVISWTFIIYDFAKETNKSVNALVAERAIRLFEDKVKEGK